MRSTAIALIVTLVMATSAFAQEAQAWRKVAEAIPLGSKVKVQTLDGRRVNGTLMSVDDRSVMVKKNTRIPEPAITVAFEQMGSLERDRGGMNWAKALGIGAATGAGAILTIFVIALQFD
jgi:hypothetical protein